MWKSSRFGRLEWALAASALCAYQACQEDETRPSAIGDCGEDCVDGPSPVLHPATGTPGAGGSSGSGGSGNGGGSAGTGGSAGSSSMQEATLSGSIQALSADLAPDASVNGAVKVQAAGVNLDQVSVSSEPNGAFRLVGVSSSLPLWVGVGAFNGDPASPFIDTLQAIDSPLSLPVQLLVLRRTGLEEILNGFMLNDSGFDATRGHAILRFIDDQRQGVTGVSLVSPEPMSTSVAYDVGATYSDQATETDLRGVMVLLNLASIAYPGATVPLGVRVRGQTHTVPARIANGAVTLVTTVIPR